MAFACVVYRGHLVAQSEHKDPVTGRYLYSISELKHPLTPPLLTTQKACLEYIRQVEPFDINERVNAYGEKRKNWSPPHRTKRNSAQQMEAYYGRTCAGYET